MFQIAETFSAYTKFCQSTFPQNQTYKDTVANCVISLIGEFGEWLEETGGSQKELLEAGDVLYYLTVLSAALGIDIADLLSHPEPDHVDLDNDWDPNKNVTDMTDLTKKHLYYSPPKYSRSEYADLMKPVITGYLNQITAIWPYATIIAHNVDKLSKRYNIHPQVTKEESQ
jgi:hypothetical protein